nr:hypothetical protein [Deinococcus misasensis]
MSKFLTVINHLLYVIRLDCLKLDPPNLLCDDSGQPVILFFTGVGQLGIPPFQVLVQPFRHGNGLWVHQGAPTTVGDQLSQFGFCFLLDFPVFLGTLKIPFDCFPFASGIKTEVDFCTP